jgi:hypothetical protein
MPVISSPEVANLYHLPNKSYTKPKPYVQALTDNFNSNSAEAEFIDPQGLNMIEYQTIDSKPVKAEIINKRFLQATKTFYLDQFLKQDAYQK